jgi:voltage-gated potassium channel
MKTIDKLVEDRKFNQFIIVLIILNVFAIMLGSVSSISLKYGDELRLFEVLSVIIFTIEYVMRLIAHRNNLVRYIFSFYAIVDLLAILPFYIPFIVKADLRFLRLLRLMRVFRIFKTTKYSSSLSVLIDVIKEKRRELGISLFICSIFLVVASFIVFYFENEAQPEQFSNLFDSIWWALATLTTVGYGDIYPVTVEGKIIAGFLALLGIGIVALPTGILSAGLMEKIGNKKTCPHCGKEIT